MALAWISAASAARESPASRIPAAGSVKIYVEEPGVYAVPFEWLASEVGEGWLGARSWRLSAGGEGVPHAVADADGDGVLGPGDRLLFVATRERLWSEPGDGSPLRVLLLEPGVREAPSPGSSPPAQAPDQAAARVERVVRFEKSALRAPLTRRDGESIPEAWYSGSISQLPSSIYRVDLGSLADRAVSDSETSGLQIAVRLLGWSKSSAPGLPDHSVDVLLNGESLGRAEWDGRAFFEARFGAVPERLLDAPNQVVSLKVAPRRLAVDPAVDHAVDPEAGPALVDYCYVDWVEVRYEVDPGILAGSRPGATGSEILGPLRIRAPGRLEARGDLALFSERYPGGLPVKTGGSPPLPEGASFWLASPGDLAPPLAAERVDLSASSVEADLDYLMIAPPHLLEAAGELAALHERRGLRVARVDVLSIYDVFGFGQRSAAAIRDFLSVQRARSSSLRFVLLVGDADWLTPFQRRPYRRRGQAEGEGRNLIPTDTVLTDFGPVASDHFFVADPADPESPTLALGRLPVAQVAELEALTRKIAAFLEEGAENPEVGDPSALLVAAPTIRDQNRLYRLRRALEAAGWSILEPGADAGSEPDAAVLAGWAEGPRVVHFDGHGSALAWQLGEATDFGESFLFSVSDFDLLPSSRRPPVVLSVSCATAPFDHPSQASFGERLVLGKRGGAIAFLGASARIRNPPRVSRLLFESLRAKKTVGEAVVAGKRAIDLPEFSSLYNLLGDPSLPLFLPPPHQKQARDVGAQPSQALDSRH
ncbi:MAG: C25 family cysteine peptidase [Acidobacteriota bacterium]